MTIAMTRRTDAVINERDVRLSQRTSLIPSVSVGFITLTSETAVGQQQFEFSFKQLCSQWFSHEFCGGSREEAGALSWKLNWFVEGFLCGGYCSSSWAVFMWRNVFSWMLWTNNNPLMCPSWPLTSCSHQRAVCLWTVSDVTTRKELRKHTL